MAFAEGQAVHAAGAFSVLTADAPQTAKAGSRDLRCRLPRWPGTGEVAAVDGMRREARASARRWGWRRTGRSAEADHEVARDWPVAQPLAPSNEIAVLRLVLHEHMTQTCRVLQIARRGPDDPLSGLLKAFQGCTDEIDGRLRGLEWERDQAAVARLIPVVSERVDRLVADASLLRQAALDVGQTRMGRSGLEHDVRDQIAGIRAGIGEIGALGQRPAPQ